MTRIFEIERFESQEMQNLLGNYWMRVPEQIRTLNRFLFIEWASARVIAGWIPAASQFEWKSKLAYFMWQNMKIAESLLQRKEELAGNSKILIPSQELELLLQDGAQAGGFPSFIAGYFLEIQKELISAYEEYEAALDPIFDAPTLELLPQIIQKKKEQLKWAQQLIHNMVVDQAILKQIEAWRAYLSQYLRHIGGITQQLEGTSSKPSSPVDKPYGPAPEKRSKPDWLQQGSLGEPPEEFADSLKIFMWHYATEIQVIDPMCYFFYGMDNMPFAFYVDYSRHIWDETRHHQMGYRRLEQMGYDLRSLPIPYNEDPTTDLEKFYLHLTMLGETCSFSRKKKSMDAFYAKGDIISGMTAEIDIVDERSHVKFGKKWLETIFRQRLNDNRTLEQLIREMIENVMSDLPEPERKTLTHFAFCGKLEFKYLNYDKL